MRFPALDRALSCVGKGTAPIRRETFNVMAGFAMSDACAATIRPRPDHPTIGAA